MKVVYSFCVEEIYTSPKIFWVAEVAKAVEELSTPFSSNVVKYWRENKLKLLESMNPR